MMQLIRTAARASDAPGRRARSSPAALAGWCVVIVLLGIAARSAYLRTLPARLVAAARRGDSEAVDGLLRAGIDPNFVLASTGETPLSAAIHSRSVPTVETLLRHGARPTSWFVTTAVQLREPAVLSALLAHGGSPNVPCWPYPTCLDECALENQPEVAAVLVRAGALVDHRTGRRATALIDAAAAGEYAMVRLLIDSGADVNLRDRRGMTALAWALRRRSPAVAALLRKHGARP